MSGLTLALRLALPLTLTTLALGCPEGETGGEDPTPDPCADAPQLLGVTPEADEGGVYTDTVSATWDAVPGAPTLVVTDSAGGEVAGTITDDDSGRTLRFTANEVLAPSSTFTATVTYECLAAPAPWSFSTGPYGDTLADPSVLVDQVFNIDLGSANIVEPAGVGALLQGLLADVYILFQITDDSDFDASALHVMGALGEVDGGDLVQDMCSESLPLTYGEDGEINTADDVLAGWENPWLRVGPTDLTLEVQGTTATVQDLDLDLLFHPDGSDFVGGSLAGTIDTRPLVGLVDTNEPPDPNAICALVEETVGLTCDDCGNGEMFCLSLVAEDIEGAVLPNTMLVTVTADDIANDPGCPEE